MHVIRIICSERSGTHSATATVASVLHPKLATLQGWEVGVVHTEHPGHARELAAAAAVDEVDMVIAVGGDGGAKCETGFSWSCDARNYE